MMRHHEDSLGESQQNMTRRNFTFGLGLVIIASFLFAQKDSPARARNAVDALNRQIVQACQERDFNATAALWADNGVDLLPGLAPMVGKTKITAWLESLRPQTEGGRMRYCTIDWQDIQIHKDVAYEWGINRQLIEYPPPRKSAPNEGKILYILRRQADGTWKIALESWNSSPLSQEQR